MSSVSQLDDANALDGAEVVMVSQVVGDDWKSVKTTVADVVALAGGGNSAPVDNYTMGERELKNSDNTPRKSPGGKQVYEVLVNFTNASEAKINDVDELMLSSFHISSRNYLFFALQDGLYSAEGVGGNETRIVTSNHIGSIAVDSENLKVYWLDTLALTLNRADYDGANAEVLYTWSSVGFNDICIWNDEYASTPKVFVATNTSVERFNLDGTNREAIAIGATSVAINGEEQSIFYTAANGDVKEVGFDGSPLGTRSTGQTNAAGIVRKPGGGLYWVSNVGIRKYTSGQSSSTLLSISNATDLFLDEQRDRFYIQADRKIYSCNIAGGDLKIIPTSQLGVSAKYFSADTRNAEKGTFTFFLDGSIAGVISSDGSSFSGGMLLHRSKKSESVLT